MWTCISFSSSFSESNSAIYPNCTLERQQTLAMHAWCMQRRQSKICTAKRQLIIITCMQRSLYVSLYWTLSFDLILLTSETKQADSLFLSPLGPINDAGGRFRLDSMLRGVAGAWEVNGSGQSQSQSQGETGCTAWTLTIETSLLVRFLSSQITGISSVGRNLCEKEEFRIQKKIWIGITQSDQ